MASRVEVEEEAAFAVADRTLRPRARLFTGGGVAGSAGISVVSRGGDEVASVDVGFVGVAGVTEVRPFLGGNMAGLGGGEMI